MLYSTVCVFAAPRSGSNLLCEQLANGLLNSGVSVPVVNFYELLSPHAHVTNQGDFFNIDIHGSLPRPNPMPIDIYRLNRLRDLEDSVSVFKIFPRDITVHNIGLIEELIFNNRSAYRICLNRTDIGNQILSYFISQATGVWHTNQSHTREKKRIIQVTRPEMEKIGNEIMLHYLWHAENRHRCHQVVWYDQIGTATYPGLFNHNQTLPASQEKLNSDHESKAESCIINASELIDYARTVEDALDGLRGYLR